MVATFAPPEVVAAERLSRAAAFDPNRTWVDGNALRLSDRVWLAGRTVRDTIDRTLVAAMVSGESAILTAKKLEHWLTPTLAPYRNAQGKLVRGQPKSVVTGAPGGAGRGSYPARRLARTEISRAHAAATIAAAEANPFVEGVKWSLSGGHPKADQCDTNARRDSGFGRGVYRPHDFPRMPQHPMCRCYASPVAVEDVRSVVAGLRSAYGLDTGPPPGVNRAAYNAGQRAIADGLLAELFRAFRSFGLEKAA